MSKIMQNLEHLYWMIQAEPKKKIHMDQWKKEDPVCGTLHCSLGLATTSQFFQDQGLEMLDSYILVNGDSDTARFDELFGPDAYDVLFDQATDTEERKFADNHKKIALARLRARILKYKKKGVPDHEQKTDRAHP
jgi:hypothetical protein